MRVRPSTSSVPAIVSTLRGAGCVFAEDEAELLNAAARTPDELQQLVDRRVAGEPLEYILGWAEFCGLRITVEPGVFVPRARTGFLVVCAAALGQRGAVILDLCCGSGAVGVALVASLGSAELYASDLDPAAARCARRNIRSTGTVFEGDLFDPLPAVLRGRVDLLTVNAPYVPTQAIRTMPPEARLHEARVALDGGDDGLDVQRRVVAGALDWLAPGGHVLIETSERQASGTLGLLAYAGLAVRLERSEESDSTVAIGTRSGSSGIVAI